MAITSHDIAGTVEGFIRREFRVTDDDPQFSRDVHLFESGYVDSLGVIELIAFVESTFNIKLQDEHIFNEAFTTINGISCVVDGCIGGAAARPGMTELAAAQA